MVQPPARPLFPSGVTYKSSEEQHGQRLLCQQDWKGGGWSVWHILLHLCSHDSVEVSQGTVGKAGPPS